MPQVRHKALTATTQIVTPEQAAALIASGEYVAVDLPEKDKGEPSPAPRRKRSEAD